MQEGQLMVLEAGGGGGGLCGKRADGDFPCDRPTGHKGGCAGRLNDLERIEREYSWSAAEVIALRRQLHEAEARALHAERQLAAATARPSGLRRLLRRRA